MKLAALTFLASLIYLQATETLTNHTAPPNFRVVEGQVYNIEKSKLWKTYSLKVDHVYPEGVVAFYWVSAGVKSRYSSQPIFVRNYPTNPPPVDGAHATLKLMRPHQATYKWITKVDEQTMELWDAGTPYILPRTNSGSAAVSNHP